MESNNAFQKCLKSKTRSFSTVMSGMEWFIAVKMQRYSTGCVVLFYKKQLLFTLFVFFCSPLHCCLKKIGFLCILNRIKITTLPAKYYRAESCMGRVAPNPSSKFLIKVNPKLYPNPTENISSPQNPTRTRYTSSWTRNIQTRTRIERKSIHILIELWKK